MKKLLAITLIFVMLIALVALCACHEHEFGEWTIVVQSTCTTNGEKQRECDCNERQTETIPATGHTPGDWIVITNATCKSEGSKQQKCSVCDAVLKIETVQITDHTPGDWIIDVEPTCTTEGTKHQNCSVCGVLVKTETISATGHKKEAVVTQPTCTAEGYTTYSCACGVNYIGNITPALGHDLVEHEGQEPTCTEVGWDAYVACSRCDYSTYNELSKTTHQYGSWWEVTPATCTQAGIEQRFCSCGDRDTRDIEPLGHAYNSNKVCSRCGDVNYSQGLKYTLINGGTEAEVSGIGTCQDAHIVIAPTYNSIPVTQIGIEAFRGCTTLSKVTLPDSIRVIDSYAFYDVGSGRVVFEIAEGVQTIGQFAFAKNTMANFTLPNSVTRIHKGILFESTITNLTLPFVGETLDGATNNYFGWIFNATNYMDNNNKVLNNAANVTITGGTIIARGAFFGCEYIQSIVLPSTLKTIDTVAFYGCKQLQHIAIPNGVTTIGSQSFQNCQALQTILLPTSVTTVVDYAFNGCPNINRIYYAGSQEDWNKISVGDNNGEFHSGKVVYNCTEVIQLLNLLVTLQTALGNFRIWLHSINLDM